MAAPPRPNDIPISRLSAGADEAEYFDIADDPNEVEILDPETEGGAFADEPGERQESAPPNEGFYSNLADGLDTRTQDRICTDLIRLIDLDREARKKRDDQYAEGIKRTGMGKEAPGGADFQGASRVVHPILIEASIDYQSRIMKELVPPSGPVKPGLLGVPTKHKTDKAERVADHMNYQIMHQIKGARSTLEVLFAQVPLGGSQYIRQYWDHNLSRPAWVFASIDHVLVPYHAADFASATRKTFVERVDRVEFHKRIKNGQYVDHGDLGMATQITDPTAAEQAKEKVEGVNDPGMNEDDDRQVYETMAYLDVTSEMMEVFGDTGDEEEGDMCPYLISIDVSSKKMLSMYRSWEEGDKAREPIDHLYEFPFVPWEGAYAIGFPQMIGGLAQAATGALRGLLDAAHVNNTPSAIGLKGSGVGGQNIMPNPGDMLELESGTEADDIRKRVMPLPFNPPSTVLLQLLGVLVDAAKGVVRTTLDETPQNSGSPVPVGTQMSRVEEGLTVFSAIHGRAHAAMDRLIKGLHRLNRLYLPSEIKIDAAGKEIMVRRRDYEGPCDIVPVSDPTIYSEVQRFTQLQYIQQRQLATTIPGQPPLYKAYEVEIAGLRLMKWPDPEQLLHVQKEATEQNAVNENLALCLQQPIEVYPDQDHLAHLQVHLDFMKSQALVSNELMGPLVLPPMLHHLMTHVAYFYATTMEHKVSDAAQMPYELLASANPQVKLEFDRTLAMASQAAMPEIEQALAGSVPVIMQAMELAKKYMPKPPMDPAQAAVQAAAAETDRKTKADAANNQLETQKLAQSGELDKMKLSTDANLRAQAQAIQAELDRRKLDQDGALGTSKLQLGAATVAGKAAADATRAETDHEKTVVASEHNDVLRDNAELAADTKIRTTTIDSETALDISEARIRSGQGSNFKNGNSLSKP